MSGDGLGLTVEVITKVIWGFCYNMFAFLLVNMIVCIVKVWLSRTIVKFKASTILRSRKLCIPF